MMRRSSCFSRLVIAWNSKESNKRMVGRWRGFRTLHGVPHGSHRGTNMWDSSCLIARILPRIRRVRSSLPRLRWKGWRSLLTRGVPKKSGPSSWMSTLSLSRGMTRGISSKSSWMLGYCWCMPWTCLMWKRFLTRWSTSMMWSNLTARTSSNPWGRAVGPQQPVMSVTSEVMMSRFCPKRSLKNPSKSFIAAGHGWQSMCVPARA